VAQFLPRYLPGNPAITPQNTPGASGLRVAEIVSNVAPRDGLTIAITQPQMVFNKAIDRTLRIRPQDFNWIGRMGSFITYAVVWHTSPVQTIADAKARPMIMGASGPTGPGAVLPTALNALIGTKFHLVKGYKSASESGLALERGEIQGIGSASLEYVESRGWLAKGLARMLFTIGTVRNPRVPDAPTAVELMQNDRDRSVMSLIVSGSVIGRAFMAPPGVPADRVAVLRQAFAKMVRDPEFIAESARRGFDVEPMTGEDLQKMVAADLAMPDDIVARTRKLVQTIP
jgi:tripartite-type tricarboxylate transporter receptor subunit TctC